MWTVITRPLFDSWLFKQNLAVRQKILAVLNLLKNHGATLGRPYVDTLNGSKYKNLKELRVQCHGKPFRIFFIFDPTRNAIVLCAGDKTGDKLFYETMIPVAEKEYEDYLEQLKDKQ